jgi:hypothetical protein
MHPLKGLRYRKAKCDLEFLYMKDHHHIRFFKVFCHCNIRISSRNSEGQAVWGLVVLNLCVIRSWDINLMHSPLLQLIIVFVAVVFINNNLHCSVQTRRCFHTPVEVRYPHHSLTHRALRSSATVRNSRLRLVANDLQLAIQRVALKLARDQISPNKMAVSYAKGESSPLARLPRTKGIAGI